MTSRSDKIILAVIIFAAFFLRVWGIGFGLPFQAHQDEPIVVNHALAYGSGDLNPHFFNIPPLTSYLLFAAYAVLFLAGKAAGAWASSGDFALRFFMDPTVFYIVGRFFIGVVPGVICVVLTCRLASRLFSERASLYASAVMALAFLNVANSHYIYTDMFLVMLTLMACISFFKVYDDNSIKNNLMAGFLIGLAAAVKYNGGILLFSYILAHVLGARKGRERSPGKLVLGCAAGFAAFIMANPFAVIDFNGFWVSFTAQSRAFWPTGLSHHFVYSLTEGISLPLAVLGLAGIAALATAGDRGKIFVSFPALFYAVLVVKSQHFARYVLPLVPFLAIGAAYLVFHVFPHFVKAMPVRRAVWGIAIVLMMPTAVKSIKADMIFSSTDTRLEAGDWIRANIEPGAGIACDSTVFRPALSQPYAQLEGKKSALSEQPGLENLKTRKLELMMLAADKNKKGYPLYFLYADPAAQGQFLDTLPALPFDLTALRKKGIEYVVINGQLVSEAKSAFLKELEGKASIAMDFSPYFDGRFKASADTIDATCIPIAGRELFSRRSSGPSLRIYRIKQ